MRRMTYEEYDKMLEGFAGVEMKPIWPTIEDIDEVMEKNPEKYLDFAVYIYESGIEAKDKDEKLRKKHLFSFINRHLELVEKLNEK